MSNADDLREMAADALEDAPYHTQEAPREIVRLCATLYTCTAAIVDALDAARGER